LCNVDFCEPPVTRLRLNGIPDQLDRLDDVEPCVWKGGSGTTRHNGTETERNDQWLNQ